MTPRILIIGGGIGGLCLAQGLRQAGVPATVYERSQNRTDWLQGYRIHINPHGSRALHRCLQPATWQAFLNTVSTTGDRFAFVTEQLHPLIELDTDVTGGDPDPAHQHHGVSRITLRQVLLDGLGAAVEFGKTFERYELTGDGQVTARFADGSSATGDLLVGADGANSRVRQQLLPHAKRIDTGVVAVAGKYHLTEASRARLPAALTTRVNTIVPARRGFMFTAVWQGDRQPVTSALSGHEIGGNDPTAARQPGLLLDNTADYTFWAYAESAKRFLADGQLDRRTGAALQQSVLDEIQAWSPDLRRLVAESDPATVNAMAIRSATPVDPWPTGPVTLLGDAIHNMTPMAGIGANTALRDADLLCRQLTTVHHGRQALVPAVHEYERQMLDYGFAAVRTSLRNTRMAGSANPITRRAFRGILRLASAVPPMKRGMFSDIGQ
jgi:2-polyprenyl-6-methoxyphenol hydroxylase-like FAD-dependent oxidoreductase